MPLAAAKVKFFFDGISVNIKQKRRLKMFVEDMFKKEKTSLHEINYVFCNDRRLLAINRKYLGHDYYTDIITFDLSGNRNAITAEVYVSVDRVRENAAIHEVTINEELQRVIFHGVLHLCGYADKTLIDRNRMRRREDYYLAKFR